VKVLITAEARRDFEALPALIQQRVRALSSRLAEWPDISGAKPLRHAWRGCYRIRTGDWRVIFRPSQAEIWIIRIAHRREVYEE
jgi:mRNA interferase RelE/StbE